MSAAVWVQVEHLVSGRRFLAEYNEDRGELWIDGALVPLWLYWAVAQLAPVERAGEPWQDLYGYDPADAEEHVFRQLDWLSPLGGICFRRVVLRSHPVF